MTVVCVCVDMADMPCDDESRIAGTSTQPALRTPVYLRDIRVRYIYTATENSVYNERFPANDAVTPSLTFESFSGCPFMLIVLQPIPFKSPLSYHLT